ncbi:lysophospholipid hydrolase, partial [Nematocida major]|uniref:lysophospholipid hydrolase n=1 Tax=Nematocida major TaxID=1912982 RepID=UPI00200750D9
QKTDSCYILSSAEIEKTFTFKAPHESRICEILLLNYLREIQREHAYVLIPILGRNPAGSPPASQEEPQTKPESEEAGESPSAEGKCLDPEKTESEESLPEGGKDLAQSCNEKEVHKCRNALCQRSSSFGRCLHNFSPSSERRRIDPIFLSEIVFYVVTNGDHRSLEIGKNVFCKIDTLVLHRNSDMKVSSGKYYGQKHNVVFPIIDVPLSVIKSRESNTYARSKHCKFTGNDSSWIPYFPLNDMHRFIRTLKGTNVGLVLGGGGARGIAHIGIIEALEEAGIPIDAVGGTSMGAFVGALYAETTSNKYVFSRAKRLSKLISSVWRVILDLTYPICSMFTGKGFNWGLRIIFKGKRIEDLWLPYYCITTDISQFREVKHTDGVLWRYVRASMSLSGYLPPLCDKGSFLLDGGYMNNVPADAMRSMGIRKIIAVDVGSEVENTFSAYGDSLNGFYILFQKVFGTKKFMSMTEIQYRLAYLTSMHKERSLKSDLSIKYIRPDLAGYKTMNFRQFDEIVAHGYQYGRKVIEEWKKTGEYLELTAHTNPAGRK